MIESQSEESPKNRKQNLQEKEFLLKAKQTLNQLKIDQRNLWLSSPLLIALATSIGGLAGATLTGLLEVYSSAQLERQKFEFSLIEKQLSSIHSEEEKTTNELDKAKQEAAESLVFLVDVGIIKSLNKEQIRQWAQNPSGLPQLHVRAIQIDDPYNAANIRSGPGAEYSVVGTYINGTAVTLLGEFGEGWYRVQVGQTTGWLPRQALGL